jgi:hypothetical protein
MRTAARADETMFLNVANTLALVIAVSSVLMVITFFIHGHA